MDPSGWASDLPALGTTAIAAGLAAVVGLERELARKPAGLRTHMLVGAASAVLVLLGDNVVERFAADGGPGRVTSDPIRVVEAVIVGISFLGAGTIARGQGGDVEGLTTAASILLTAAIGMSVAVGQVSFAAMLTGGTVGVLWIVGVVERRLFAPGAGEES